MAKSTDTVIVDVVHSASTLGVLGLIGLSLECYASAYAHQPDDVIRFWFERHDDALDFMEIFKASIPVPDAPKKARKKKVKTLVEGMSHDSGSCASKSP